MKIYSNNNLGDTWSDGSKYGDIRLFEDDDYIFINGKAHDKTTLSPIFGKSYNASSHHSPYMRLDNCVMIPTYGEDFEIGYDNGHTSYYGPLTMNSHLTNNGQSNLCGINAKYTWQSLYEPNIIYFHEAGGYHGRVVGVDKTKNYKRVRFLYTRGPSQDWYSVKGMFFHEDEDYLYSFMASRLVNASNDYRHHFAKILKKGTGGMYRGGYRNEYTHDFTMFYKDENTFMYSMAHWNFSDYRPGFGIRKINFNDDWTPGWTTEWHVYRDEGNKSYQDLLRHYVPTEGEDYTTGSGQMYRGRPLSDGNTLTFFGTNYYYTCSPAIVHDHDETQGLRVKHNVARLYYATFNEDGHLKILRANVPIKDHEGFVNTTAPIFDIRYCNISTEGLHTENIAFDDLRYNGDMYHGSDSAGHNFFCMSYFYDEFIGEKRHFLMFTTEQRDGLGHYNTHSGGTRAWVFEIDKFDEALDDYLHEIKSLDLKLVQVLDVTTVSCYQVFRPDYDPKKWIAFRNGKNKHDIYTWNPATKQFITNSSIYGRLTGMQVDSTGRLYTIHNPSDHRFEIHIESIDYPARIIIEPTNDRLDYVSSPITTTIEISAFNYEGTQIDLNNVKLKINGINTKFDNNSKEKIVNLQKDAILEETLTISGPTELDITATI